MRMGILVHVEKIKGEMEDGHVFLIWMVLKKQNKRVIMDKNKMNLAYSNDIFSYTYMILFFSSIVILSEWGTNH